MLEFFIETGLRETDLDVVYFGESTHSPGQHHGPVLRDHYVLSYVIGGKGSYKIGDRTCQVEAGSIYVIFPDELCYEEADSEEPWEIMWVAFKGLKAQVFLEQCNIKPDSPLVGWHDKKIVRTLFDQIIGAVHMEKGRNIYLIGLLHLLFSHLVEACPVEADPGNGNKYEVYINKVIEYVEKNYTNNITILEISREVGLSRGYLSSLFKKYLNSSPELFLLNFRITRACDLLLNRSLSISNISALVGYEDPLSFSRAFRKIKGMSPSNYRSKH